MPQRSEGQTKLRLGRRVGASTIVEHDVDKGARQPWPNKPKQSRKKAWNVADRSSIVSVQKMDKVVDCQFVRTLQVEGSTVIRAHGREYGGDYVAKEQWGHALIPVAENHNRSLAVEQKTCGGRARTVRRSNDVGTSKNRNGSARLLKHPFSASFRCEVPVWRLLRRTHIAQEDDPSDASRSQRLGNTFSRNDIRTFVVVIWGTKRTSEVNDGLRLTDCGDGLVRGKPLGDRSAPLYGFCASH
jgi:hypothetical protein